MRDVVRWDTCGLGEARSRPAAPYWHRYTKAWSLLADGDAMAGGEPLLSAEEQRMIMGGNLARLFPGGWY